MSKPLSGLGRGLASLIPQKQTVVEATVKKDSGDNAIHAAPFLASVGDIRANPEQPRVIFRRSELEELMNSIREHGIVQPLIVSMGPAGGYELIAGERRLRAAKMLGISKVPVVVRSARADEKLLLALIENIQRADLNPLEEARAYERLCNEFGLTQDQVAKQVGKARSTVANTIRLLELPAEIQEAIASGAVAAGTARAILGLPDAGSQTAFFRKLLKEKMSTREAEAGARLVKGKSARSPALSAHEERLRRSLGARVEIKKKNGAGSVLISFYSEEEFQELLKKLSR